VLKAEFKNVAINRGVLSSQLLSNADIYIFYAPKDVYTLEEIALIRTYLSQGGSVLVIMANAENRKAGSINGLISEYGITVNNDSVLRAAYKKYTHPREALVSNGILIDEIVRRYLAGGILREAVGAGALD